MVQTTAPCLVGGDTGRAPASSSIGQAEARLDGWLAARSTAAQWRSHGHTGNTEQLLLNRSGFLNPVNTSFWERLSGPGKLASKVTLAWKTCIGNRYPERVVSAAEDSPRLIAAVTTHASASTRS